MSRSETDLNLEGARQMRLAAAPRPPAPSSPDPLMAEEIVAVYVGSMRAPDVMRDLTEAGYTVCGPDCGCSCLALPSAPDHRLREALDELRDDLASLAYDLTRSPNGPAEFRGEIGGVIARHRDNILRAVLSDATPSSDPALDVPDDERFVRLATAVMQLRDVLALHRKATGRSDVNIRKVLALLDDALSDRLAASQTPEPSDD